jgi:hypothetical protein
MKIQNEKDEDAYLGQIYMRVHYAIAFRSRHNGVYHLLAMQCK